MSNLKDAFLSTVAKPEISHKDVLWPHTKPQTPIPMHLGKVLHVKTGVPILKYKRYVEKELLEKPAGVA